MHEYSIAYDIFATARRAAVENHATLVKRVCVDLGEMAMVNPEQVTFLFGLIAGEDQLFAGVVLECKTIMPETRCVCGYAGSEVYVCPSCGALPEMVRGREIVVSNIEIEVDEA